MPNLTFARERVEIPSLCDGQVPSLYQDTTFLEACIENHTKTNLYMDQVDFEPAQHWSATLLQADDNYSENDSLAR